MFQFVNTANAMHVMNLRTIVKRPLGRFLTSSLARAKAAYDPMQEAALKERCFLVDEDDNVIGTATKRECHSVKPDGTIPLHRAFSVFLFDKKGDLLLQKRAHTKITYPGYYTFSCSGHPLVDIEPEKNENDAIGIKLAAQRRLVYELGVLKQEVPLELIYYVTRIYHKNHGNGVWGDHEICYILLIQTHFHLHPKYSELSEFSLVPKGHLTAFLPKLASPITPLFEKVLKHRLELWWNNLNDLDSVKDRENILKL